MKKLRSIRSNIPLDFIFTFLFAMNLTHGVWMIYLTVYKDFSLLQLGTLEGLFHLTSILMEVPTGAVSDIWGRRISRISGRLVFIISLILLYLADPFWLQALGFVFCAISYNLESGSGDALVYDSLLSIRIESGYMKIKGRKEFIYQGAGILAFLLGGFLAVGNYPLLFSLSGLFALLAVLNAFLFTEPPLESPESRIKTGFSLSQIIASIMNQTGESLSIIRQRPRIAFLIIFTELIFTFTTSLFFYLQNFWKSSGRDEFYIGIIFAFQSALAGISGLTASWFEKRIGERNILRYIPLFLLFCLGGIALTGQEAPFYILTGLLDGLLFVAVSDYINRIIPSENRATILSFESMVFSFFMILLFPLMGFLGDPFTLKRTFQIIFLSACVLYGIYYLLFIRKDREKKNMK